MIGHSVKQYHIVGQRPLLVHNSRLANPTDPLVKQIKEFTGKRKKTEEDQDAIFRLEWEGGLYWNAEDGPYVPGENMEAVIKNAAKLQKRGRDVSRGLHVVENCLPILYKGPREVKALYALQRHIDVRSVVIGGKRTMRCRPVFPEWELQFTLSFDTEVFNPGDVDAFVLDGGKYIGLCEMRPRFGTFDLKASGRQAKAS